MTDATKAMALAIGERLARDRSKGTRCHVSPVTIGKFAAAMINEMDAALTPPTPHKET